jgi:hypothetical protein
MWRRRRHHVAIDLDFPAARLDMADQRPKQGGLPHAVAPHQPDGFARSHGKIDAV